jgi:hypothetical protein
MNYPSTPALVSPTVHLGARMPHFQTNLKLDISANYRISVQGDLDSRWFGFMNNVSVVREHDSRTTVTTLMGTVKDQSELLGILSALNSLGFPLLLVECVKA